MAVAGELSGGLVEIRVLHVERHAVFDGQHEVLAEGAEEVEPLREHLLAGHPQALQRRRQVSQPHSAPRVRHWGTTDAEEI